MAQKSLPILNKVNTSMIWYSTYYNKYYKWLSSQNLYFLYFFNKLTVFMDIFFFNIMWVFFEKTSLYYNVKSTQIRELSDTRFFKPVTSYLINLKEKSLIINVFYKTSLQRFQDAGWEERYTMTTTDKFKSTNLIKKSFFN